MGSQGSDSQMVWLLNYLKHFDLKIWRKSFFSFSMGKISTRPTKLDNWPDLQTKIQRSDCTFQRTQLTNRTHKTHIEITKYLHPTNWAVISSPSPTSCPPFISSSIPPLPLDLLPSLQCSPLQPAGGDGGVVSRRGLSWEYCCVVYHTAWRLPCMALHCTKLQCTAVHHTAVHHTAVHHTAVHLTALHWSEHSSFFVRRCFCCETVLQ